MAKEYPEEARELCRRLYCKYGGKNYDAIERDMRRAGWSNWSKKNLDDRAGNRMGWVTKFGFENSLRLHLEKLVEKVNDDVQDLYLAIKTIRKKLQAEALGRNASKDVRRELREYAKLEIDARDRLDLTRANLETFAEAYELLSGWAVDIDAELATRFVKNADRFMELAQAHYGKQEDSIDDGAGPGEDEGGDGEGEDEDRIDLFIR